MDSKIVELHSLARSLVSNFELGGARSEIDEAIILDREALALSPLGHSIQMVSLNQLAVHLSDRYSQLGAVTDIDEAITLGRDTLALCSPEHPAHSMILSNLAVRLATRYARLGETKDIEEAINLGKDALLLRPSGHPDRSTSLNNVAIDLCVRFHRSGKLEDLDEAIVLCRGALSLCPSGHQDRCLPLNNLVRCLSTRYLQLKGAEDLDEAIILGREALGLRPQGHAGRSLPLNNLSASLFTRYEQLGGIEDINEAIIIGREALVLCPPCHPDRPMALNNVGMYLSARYRQLKETEDIDEALVLDRNALTLRPPGHPGRSISLTNLAVRLSLRYEQLDNIEDLEEAITLGRASLSLFPLQSPRRSQALEYLTNYLYFRLKRSNQLQDKEEIFSLYTQMVNTPQAVSSADLSAVKVWTRVAERFHHPTTLLSYETSLQLLVRHLTVLPPLPQHLNVLKDLTSSLSVDAFSACLRRHSPAKAVELLEQGRGVFWSQLSRFRSPLDDVASNAEGMPLANEFERLASLIRSALGSPGVDQHDRVCHLNVELHNIVASIRELPGFSRFLLPSLFSELQQAASGGPVIVVNASIYGCDALIILLDRDPVQIPFQITRESIQDLASKLRTCVVRAETEDMTNHIAVLLREVWEEMVSPIVNFLQTIYPSQSRIWWCPTAEFTLLPLHAAGPYKNGEKRLSDFYISSYTPTLTALIHARRHQPMNSASQGKRFVGISQAKAKDMNECELHAVGEELSAVGQQVRDLATFTSIEGPDACIARVAQELNQAQWVHLACHGVPNPTQPFQSAFALHDGPFTIEHINRCELQSSAQFAYLSACHTTVGDADSPDEMIHLASAMQFAGFRSVIGTMWAVDDDQAKKISSTFYDYMVDASGSLDHTRAAFALHKTLKKVKGISFDQRILYVHIGA